MCWAWTSALKSGWGSEAGMRRTAERWSSVIADLYLDFLNFITENVGHIRRSIQRGLKYSEHASSCVESPPPGVKSRTQAVGLTLSALHEVCRTTGWTCIYLGGKKSLWSSFSLTTWLLAPLWFRSLEEIQGKKMSSWLVSCASQLSSRAREKYLAAQFFSFVSGEGNILKCYLFLKAY